MACRGRNMRFFFTLTSVVFAFVVVFIYTGSDVRTLAHLKYAFVNEASHPDLFYSSAVDQRATTTATLSEQQGKQYSIFCWVASLEKWISSRVKAVNETWVKRFDGHIFFIERQAKNNSTQTLQDVVSLNVLDGRKFLSAKSKAAFMYAYQHYLSHHDWFVKADDDTFIIVENLRLLLSKLNASKPVYVGRLFKVFVKTGYMSGGAGYVLSREALRLLVEEGYGKGKCNFTNDSEDIYIGLCLDRLGVTRYDSRDKLGRDTFHPEAPKAHIAASSLQSWITHYSRFTARAGKECCSELTISFHHMGPEEILVMEHLLYRTTVYGRAPDFTKLQDMFQAQTVLPP